MGCAGPTETGSTIEDVTSAPADAGSVEPDAGSSTDAPDGEEADALAFVPDGTASGPCDTISEGASCDDGDACTTGDVCEGGTCVGSGTLACDDEGASDDGNPCTWEATCRAATSLWRGSSAPGAAA